MAKTNKYDSQHWRNQAEYERQIDAIYRAAAKEAAALGVSIKNFNTDKLFSFSDYPTTRKKIEKLLNGLQSDITTAIINGIRSEWTLANNKNNELARQVFGDNVGKLTKEQERRYFSTNSAARDAFITRKTDGLGLSDRVWKYTEQFKEEIELGLDIGIRNGRSADELSRDLRNYLQHPDKLFRRVRNEHGQLVLSQRAKAYHPGRGVYRSSYKNARRLAETETNIAYRTADYERWQQFDFVVGIRVVMSGNHPIKDICDELSANSGSTANSGRGCYPKDFKFTGWHPLCRCHVETILKTPDELMADNKRIIDGEEPLDSESVNKVNRVPKEFEKWLEQNEERAKRSFSIPYFIKDNEKYLPKGYKSLYAMRMPYDTYAEYEAAMSYNRKHAKFSDAIRKNNRELSEALPVIQGKIMNFTDADGNKCNPKFVLKDAREKGYYDNCQTCTVAYELRRRGFNIEALPNKDNEFYEKWCVENNFNWRDRFMNSNGTRPQYIKSGFGLKDTINDKLSFIENVTEDIGRYEIYCQWKEKDAGAHVFIVERQKDGNLLWFDPQSGRHGGTFKDSLKRMRKYNIGILRIDDKLISPKFSLRLTKSDS